MSKRTKRSGEDETAPDVSHLEGWRRARQVLDPVGTRIPTRRITINIDEDVIAAFKGEALLGGPPYQVAINQALRAHLRDRSQSAQARAAETVLRALDDREVVRRIRRIGGR